jgi:hypothetical protein
MMSVLVGGMLLLGLWTQAHAQQCWQVDSASSRIQLRMSTIVGNTYARPKSSARRYAHR